MLAAIVHAGGCGLMGVRRADRPRDLPLTILLAPASATLPMPVPPCIGPSRRIERPAGD